MKAKVAFREVTDFVGKKYNTRIKLAKTGANSITVSYRAVPILPAVDFTLDIAEVKQECIHLKYASNISMIIGSIVSFISEKIPAGIEIDSDSNTIKIYPRQIEKLEKALEFVYLDDVNIEEDGIGIYVNFV